MLVILKSEYNVQPKIGLGKIIFPVAAFPVPEGCRRQGNKKSHENSAPAAPKPSWLSIQSYEGTTIRGSFPNLPRLYDTETVLSTIVTSPW